MATHDQQMSSTVIGIPQVSHDDLFAFHEAHFSRDALSNFGQTYFNPSMTQVPAAGAKNDDWYQYADEEDGLGYYPDGVKRTLTDEQIEIFRHSELESMRRAQEERVEEDPAPSNRSASDGKGTASPADDTVNPPPLAKARSSSKKKVKRQKIEPKPDLRKRTWDVVDKGVDSLDYD